MSDIILFILIIYILNGFTFFIAREVIGEKIDCFIDVLRLAIVGMLYLIGWIGIYLEGKR